MANKNGYNEVVLTIGSESVAFAAAVKATQGIVRAFEKAEKKTIVALLPYYKAAMAVSKACFMALYNESGYSVGYRALIQRACNDTQIENIMMERGAAFALACQQFGGELPSNVMTMTLAELKTAKAPKAPKAPETLESLLAEKKVLLEKLAAISAKIAELQK